MAANRFIGEVASQAGVSVTALRFYEREGLLRPPARTEKGYRLYSDEDVREIHFVRKAQSLGFSLREVQEVLALRRQKKVACGHVERVLDEKLKAIQQRVRELKALEADLRRLAATWKKGVPKKFPPGSICPYIEKAPVLHSMDEKRQAQKGGKRISHTHRNPNRM